VLIFVFVLVNFLLAQMMALGHAFSGISDGRVSYEAAILCGAVVILVYEMLGGMRAVAWTDALQGTLLLTGIVVVVVLLIVEFGSPAEMLAQLRASNPEKVANPDLSTSWRCRI
jgi:solute:Na+ symporter, SSS family